MICRAGRKRAYRLDRGLGSDALRHIDPRIEALLGWPQASWGSVEDWANRIHPEERERVVEERVAQALAGTDHQCTYRLLKADGGWLRVADKARVVRKINGDVDCLTGTMTVTGEVKPRPPPPASATPD
jgi:PAS domain-containing protein